MENVVLEIGTEEIPAQYMENALKDLNRLAKKVFGRIEDKL